MDGTRPQPLTDTQLDRELERALGIDPSPEFLARVRTRVAAEPERRLWRLAVEPLWALGLAGILMAIVIPQFLREPAVPRQDGVGQVARITPPEIETPRDASRPAVKPVRIRERRAALPAQVEPESPRTTPLQLGPVLVNEDERRAFEFFVAAVGNGQVPEEAVKASSGESREVEALSIAPLEIAPLPSLARAGQEGEGQWE